MSFLSTFVINSSTQLTHPGRPVTEPKIVFNEFLDETTPVPNLINVDNVKTVDLAGFDQEEDDFPIYDTEIVVTNILLSLN